MKNTNRIRKQYLAVALLLTALAAVACGPDKDYLLMVDTSGSMDIQGQKLQAIKDSLPGLLEKVENGDRVTVMNFDTEIHNSNTYSIDSDADKSAVIADIEALEAKGANTEMVTMIQGLKGKLKELHAEGGERTPVVMLLTDGIDDPARRREKLDMEEFRDPEAEGAPDPYIYYVSLGKLADPALAEKLESLSGKQVTTVDKGQAGQTNAAATDGTEGAGEDGSGDELGLGEIAEHADESIWNDTLVKYGLWGLLALGVLAILGLIAFLIYKFWTRNKLIGELQYYESEINFPNKNTFRLDKLAKNSVRIGPRLGVDLRIKQLGVPKEFKFKTKVKKDRTYLKPVGRTASMVEFGKQSEAGLIGSGEDFKIGNFKFEYNDGQES